MPEDPGNLTYSEAVAAGLYGDQDPNARADRGVTTADDVQGSPLKPKVGSTQHDQTVGRPRR